MYAKMIRSPLFSLFTWWYVIAVYYIAFFKPFELSEESKHFLGVLVVLVPVGLLLMQYLYNKNHPEDRISFKRGFLPWEFHEVDEGQKWMTYNACRNVYIYYSFALPFSFIIYVLLRDTPLAPLILIWLLGTGQYLVYWLTLRKLNSSIEE